MSNSDLMPKLNGGPGSTAYLSKITVDKLSQFRKDPDESLGQLVRRAVDAALSRPRVELIRSAPDEDEVPSVMDRGMRYACGCWAKPVITNGYLSIKLACSEHIAIPHAPPEYVIGDLPVEVIRQLFPPSVA